MEPLRGKRVVVVGLGRSGVAAARLAVAEGARVTANDAATEVSGEARALRDLGVALALGGHAGVLDDADLVIVSPGVPRLAQIAAAEARGVPVLGELELAWRRLSGVPTAAIGGTNGKSTTTTLVAEMLSAAGARVFAGGNLGTPLAEIVGQEPRPDALVLEVSSFQSERTPTLRPRAAALLNITDDHLDRYDSFDAYADAKGNLLASMTPDDTAVAPFGDPVVARQLARSRARVWTFGRQGDFRVTDDAIVDGPSGRSYSRAEIALAGDHNALNAAASVAVATAMGAPEAAIRAALRAFEGLAHRIAFVRELDGVRYYDDSKGTNVGASVAALLGMREPKVVLVAGGRDKLGAYEPLVDALRRRGRAVVVIGEAAARIAAAVGDAVEVARARDMDDAVTTARRLARPGDAVLLSPACSSFDMFRDYKHRGDEFVRAVRAQGGGR